MAQWDRWGQTVLRDGDIVFRLGDARTLGGCFPLSWFIATATGSRYSHTGIVADRGWFSGGVRLLVRRNSAPAVPRLDA